MNNSPGGLIPGYDRWSGAGAYPINFKANAPD
jgi:hypothetical protein